MIPREHITGLVLAGGRGSRMGGVDKGLQPLHGRPLAQVMLERLRPQVGPCLVSANRHLDTYRGFGVPVVTDDQPDYPGPLAGLLAGLRACTTPWLLTVPCDTPGFPPDLAERLSEAADDADVAMAATEEAGRVQAQPVFCLLRSTLADDLAAFMATGGASPRAFATRHRAVLVTFADAAAFTNANTVEDLRRLP